MPRIVPNRDKTCQIVPSAGWDPQKRSGFGPICLRGKALTKLEGGMRRKGTTQCANAQILNSARHFPICAGWRNGATMPIPCKFGFAISAPRWEGSRLRLLRDQNRPGPSPCSPRTGHDALMDQRYRSLPLAGERRRSCRARVDPLVFCRNLVLAKPPVAHTLSDPFD